MLRLLNNPIVLLCAILFISCGFIDLRQIGFSVEPDSTESVLPDSYSPVIIKFDTEMMENETEAALQISSDFGTVRGDKFWNGNHLYFVPVTGWSAGIRYAINLTGTARSVDGRELRLGHYSSFYAINKNTLPVLESHSPSNGESVGIKDIVLELNFSRSMDRLSVESALTLDGIANKIFEWSDNDKILKVIAENALSPWVLYKWSLKDSAKSADGVQLSKTYSGHFITNLYKTLPKVTNIYPVMNTGGVWYPTGSDIENGLDIGHGIAVKFNKPMGENTLRSLRFEPSLTGKAEFLSEVSIVYIFSKDPEPETTYTLIVSGDAIDTSGLKIGSDYRINFTPAVPYLKLLAIDADGNTFDIASMTDNVIPIRANTATGECHFCLYFSLKFDFDEKLNTPQRIMLSPFFPRTLAPAALQFIDWNASSDRLLMRWEGLTPGEGAPHYYKLTIPGGKGGISAGKGLYMKEDITLFLEAIK